MSAPLSRKARIEARHAQIADLLAEGDTLIAAIDRHPWRLFRNTQLLSDARRVSFRIDSLFRENSVDLAAWLADTRKDADLP